MKFPRFNLWRWLWSRVWLLSERSGIGLGRFAPWVFHQMMGSDTKFKKVNIMDTRLTEAQLLFRLQEFSDAEQDAIALGDHEFARECADVVSIIRELQACREAADKPVLNVLFKNGWPVDGTTGIISGSPSFPDGYHDFYTTPQLAQDNWIKCSEKMPVQSCGQRFIPLNLLLNGRTVVQGGFDNNRFWLDGHPMDNVTHWLPMPTAPQEAKS